MQVEAESWVPSLWKKLFEDGINCDLQQPNGGCLEEARLFPQMHSLAPARSSPVWGQRLG